MSEENKKEQYFDWRRLFNPKYSIPAAFCVLGFASIGLIKHATKFHNVSQFSSVLKNALTLSSNLGKQNQLIYANGKIKYIFDTASKQQVQDSYFGIKPTSPNSFGVLRKVEMLTKDNSNQILDWKNVEDCVQHNSIEYPYLQYQAFTCGKAVLQEHTLSNSLVKQFDMGNSTKININYEEMNKHFAMLEKRFNEYQSMDINKMDSDLEFQNLSNTVYNLNPFNHTQTFDKHLKYEDNYIWIQKDLNNIQEGDIRISFHDIQQVGEATILAMKSGDNLVEHEIEKLSQKQLNYSIIVDGREQKLNLGFVNIVKKGIIPQEQLIKYIVSQLDSNSKFYSLFYALIIFLTYQFICNELGGIPNPINPIELEKEAQKAVRVGYNNYISLHFPYNKDQTKDAIYYTLQHLTASTFFIYGNLIPFFFVFYFQYHFLTDSIINMIQLEEAIEKQAKNTYQIIQNPQVDQKLFDKIQVLKDK